MGVVGGGNTALEDAILLSEKCKSVYIICRKAEFRGEQNLVEKLKTRKNVIYLMNTTVIGLNGQDKLNSVVIQNNELSESKTIAIDGLFVAIGQVPNNEIFSSLISLDEKEYIISDDNCSTNIDGIFTAGDCRAKRVRQLITAASDGAIAAISAVEYCNRV